MNIIKNSMKYMFFVAPLILFTGCSIGKTDPTFDFEGHIIQHTVDPNKGIHIVVYPVDREGEKP